MQSRAQSKPVLASFRGRRAQGGVQTQPPPAKSTSRAKRFTAVLILCSVASILSLQAEVARQANEPIPEAQTQPSSSPHLSASRLSEAQVAFPNRSAASSAEPLSRPSKAMLRWRQRSRRRSPSDVFTAGSPRAAFPLNVLMILIDDLRPALGCYGDKLAVTPHIDALANQSVRFDAAYASVATCSPSRTSLLTGLRPDTHGVHDLVTHFRTTVADATTLPQAFKRAGYLALSYGKVFHEDLDDAASWSSQADFDDGEVWRGTERVYGHDWWYMEHDRMVKVLCSCCHSSLPWPLGAGSPQGNSWPNRRLRCGRAARPKSPIPRRSSRRYDSAEHARPWQGHKFGLAWERAARPEECTVDHAIASRAGRALQRLAARPAAAAAARPFFLVAGFVRPHLPFSAPDWAWKRTGPTSRFVVPIEAPPVGASEQSRLSLARWGELRAYSGVPPHLPHLPAAEQHVESVTPLERVTPASWGWHGCLALGGAPHSGGPAVPLLSA